MRQQCDRRKEQERWKSDAIQDTNNDHEAQQ
jgi:hypothetical protein